MSAPTVGSLCSGYGGLDLAVEELTGATCAWHAEVDPNPSAVLAARWPDVPNHGDITAINWASVEPVDVICGGTPCQDLSTAGTRSGMGPGTRSGLWSAMAAAVNVIRPSLVLWENVNGALSACAHSDLEPCPRCVGGAGAHVPVLRALGRVSGDLASLGYDSGWASVRASDVGACHRRERVFLAAWPAVDTDSGRRGRWGSGEPATAGDGVEDGVGWPSGAGARVELTLLPTPVTADGRRTTTNDRSTSLGEAIELLPTPTTQPTTGNGHARDLGSEVRLLPTPTATDAAGSRGYRTDGTPYTGTAGVTLTDATTDPTRWGAYADAIVRHERAFGRTAPDPTDDKGRLSPLFVEWMMGCPDGWVTDILTSRTAALRALGNGVVSRQAVAAYRMILANACLGVSA